MFETVSIFVREAVRLVHHRAESLAIRLLARTPAAVARVFALGGVAPRLLLVEAVETVTHVEQAAEAMVDTAVAEAAAIGPLVLLRGVRALLSRRHALPLAALVLGAVGLTAFAVRRATRAHARMPARRVSAG